MIQVSIRVTQATLVRASERARRLSPFTVERWLYTESHSALFAAQHDQWIGARRTQSGWKHGEYSSRDEQGRSASPHARDV